MANRFTNGRPKTTTDRAHFCRRLYPGPVLYVVLYIRFFPNKVVPPLRKLLIALNARLRLQHLIVTVAIIIIIIIIMFVYYRLPYATKHRSIVKGLRLMIVC